MAKATISMDLTSNNNRGGAKHAKGAVTEKADRSSGHDEKLMPAPKPTSMGCFGSNERDHRDDHPCVSGDKECRLHCDKEEIKYIIRPQKIKIAEVNGTQYGWIKTGFRFIFVASLLVVSRTTHCRQIADLLFVRCCLAALGYSTGLRSPIM